MEQFVRRTLGRLVALLIVVTHWPALSHGARDGQSELVIHKEGTKQYHRAGCPVIADGKGVLALTRAQAESRGLAAHAECDPANPEAATLGGKPRQTPETVYLDPADSKYYHRKTCKKLSGDPNALKAVSLDSAAKTHWPCPTCKAPIRQRGSEPAVPGTGRRGR